MKENIEEKLKLYRGKYYGRKNLQQSNVVRIFISSTFTGLSHLKDFNCINKSFRKLKNIKKII